MAMDKMYRPERNGPKRPSRKPTDNKRPSRKPKPVTGGSPVGGWGAATPGGFTPESVTSVKSGSKQNSNAALIARRRALQAALNNQPKNPENSRPVIQPRVR